MSNNPLRHIPSVHELLESPPLRGLVTTVSHHVVVTEVRTFLDKLRGDLQQRAAEALPAAHELAERIAQWIVSDQKPRLRPVINATGILLHTGLGRSPLADEALQEVCAVAKGYGSLEIDLTTGQRSQRTECVEKLLVELTGAERAVVVNNNAAATMLVLAAVAAGREVIVSRGHLVEIGGSYRLPDVMAASGAILRDVGTTNKTRIDDFRQAAGATSGALLRVHPSNFVIHGFTEQPALAELIGLGRELTLPVIDDIGSGALVDFSQFGLANEPMARESVKAGADLVLFSGDKLLGGPQCGIIVGRAELVARVLKHPLARAVRVDKMTLAALHATLRLYRDPEHVADRVPLLRLLATSAENLRQRADRIVPQIRAGDFLGSVEAVADHAYLGGGSIPTQEIPTWCVALTPQDGRVEELAQRLREATPAIMGRIHKGRLLLDLRTVFPAEDRAIVEFFGRHVS